jgi:urease accessory protein
MHDGTTRADSLFGGQQSPAASWLIWQLIDSAFPTGGFAHSSGLEASWQYGEVKNRSELVSFVEATLHQLSRAALPFVIATHSEPDRLEEFDQLFDAFTTNHVANRASRAQGKAFLNAIQRVFFSKKEPSSPPLPATPFNHFTCIFGGTTRLLDIPQETATHLFFFNHLRGILAAAVRLNIIGPMEAQSLQHQFSATAQDILKTGVPLTLNDIAQTSPLLDIWQGAQDRLYSRLFQS